MPALLTILFRPRATMRRILDSGSQRAVVPLVLLAVVSSSLAEHENRTFLQKLDAVSMNVGLFVGAVTVGVICLLVVVFYGLSFVAVGAGRLLEGTGTVRDVRVALAWGLAPVAWAILYRLPGIVFASPPNALRVDARWGVMIALAIAQIVVTLWWVITSSNTLAEAHRFSALRGFATLMLTMGVPFVLVAAGLLTHFLM